MTDARSQATIVDVVRRAATERPGDRAYVFLGDGEATTAELDRAQLHDRARAVAHALLHARAEARPVLILCPAGLDYVSSLLGCFFARAIAVPAYPPTRTGLARTMPRIRAICDDCRPAAVLTTRAVQEVLQGDAQLAAVIGALPLIAVDALAHDPAAPPLPAVGPDDLALLQYTSGSTSAPKGVLVTHGQLVANAELIAATSELASGDRVLSWLPPYHDMGLVGGIMQPLFAGCLSILMPPDAFLRRPLRWLKSATTWRATVLLAPNFALDACVRRIDAEDRALLDLDPVRVVCIGAEPIRSDTLERFVNAFAEAGFRRDALFPCYGMAEATLMITAGSAHEPPIVRRYAQDGLEQGRAEPVPEHGPEHGPEKARALVSCGRAIAGERVSIVDPETRRVLADGRVGEVWVQSPAIASGYFERPDETEHAFRAFTAQGIGPMLRTGDLGFLDRGELFITGRLKDLIIVRGRNHAPQDIERTVQALDEALVMDSGAAFSIERGGAEQLAIVQEVDKRTGKDPAELLARIPDAIREAHDITPAEVVLIKRGSLGKTSSGKIQRRAMRSALLEGSLDVVARWHAPGLPPSASAVPPGPSGARSSRAPTLEEAAKVTARITQTPGRRALEIEAWLRDRIAEKLGIAPDEIDPRETLARYGVDSALAAELVEELERWLQIRLDTTISYDHPTIAGLSRALAAMSSGAPGTEHTRPTSRPPASAASLRPTVPARARLDENDDPIAIVGMACRFPGAPSLEAFWELLVEGRDAITEVPRERWDADALYAPEPGTPGKMCSKWGGFIDDIDRFDAAFFGVSPHEAARMDPQQRLFLEVAWEALEDAGLAPSRLAGTRTGVFAGVCTSDYALLYGGELRLVDGDYGTGSATSVVANRLSYVLDLKGPSEALDSACSSALAALHRAAQSLAQQDCDLAIVGGVNAVLAPEVSVSFSQIGALARDGRCKAFDARADGFVRGEGAGVVVLKRLSAAQQAGDHVYALLAGSAVNHDGRSNGLSAPSGPAQRDVIGRALARAGITAGELDYVEAHGVGTQVADAVELHALSGLLEESERAAPLVIGSAKTNVGHLEAASGMVSVIKVALALARERLPGQLHCEQPIAALQSARLRVATATEAWPRGERPRHAGASSFGFGGANAHVVLREAPLPLPAPERRGASHVPELIALSARTPSALASAVRRLAEHLDRVDEQRLADVAFTLAAGRSAFGERVALVCASLDELRDGLLSIALGATPKHAVRGTVKASATPRFALVLGEGPVPAEAVAALRTAQPRFAATLDQDARLLQGVLEAPLAAALWEGTAEARAALLARPSIAHAARAALQHALCKLLRALGLEPAVIVGRGAGEYAAAAAAGCLPWDQAVLHAARRGALLEGFTQGAAQRLTLRDAKQALAGVDAVARAPHISLVSAQLDRALAAGERLDAAFWSQHLLTEDKPLGPGAQGALERAGCEVVVSDAEGAGAELALLGGARGDLSMLHALATLFAHGVPFELDALSEGRPRRKLSLPTYPFERERHWLDFPERERRVAARASTLAPPGQPLTERPISHPLVGRMRSSRPAGPPSARPSSPSHPLSSPGTDERPSSAGDATATAAGAAASVSASAAPSGFVRKADDDDSSAQKR